MSKTNKTRRKYGKTLIELIKKAASDPDIKAEIDRYKEGKPNTAKFLADVCKALVRSSEISDLYEILQIMQDLLHNLHLLRDGKGALPKELRWLAAILVVAPDWNTLNWDDLEDMGIVEEETAGKKGETVEDADTDEEVSINRNFGKTNHTRFQSDEDNTSSVEESDSNTQDNNEKKQDEDNNEENEEEDNNEKIENEDKNSKLDRKTLLQRALAANKLQTGETKTIDYGPDVKRAYEMFCKYIKDGNLQAATTMVFCCSSLCDYANFSFLKSEVLMNLAYGTEDLKEQLNREFAVDIRTVKMDIDEFKLADANHNLSKTIHKIDGNLLPFFSKLLGDHVETKRKKSSDISNTIGLITYADQNIGHNYRFLQPGGHSIPLSNVAKLFNDTKNNKNIKLLDIIQTRNNEITEAIEKARALAGLSKEEQSDRLDSFIEFLLAEADNILLTYLSYRRDGPQILEQYKLKQAKYLDRTGSIVAKPGITNDDWIGIAKTFRNALSVDEENEFIKRVKKHIKNERQEMIKGWDMNSTNTKQVNTAKQNAEPKIDTNALYNMAKTKTSLFNRTINNENIKLFELLTTTKALDASKVEEYMANFVYFVYQQTMHVIKRNKDNLDKSNKNKQQAKKGNRQNNNSGGNHGDGSRKKYPYGKNTRGRGRARGNGT